MTNPRPSAVCVLTLPHRPHMWITSGTDYDCPGWTEEYGNARRAIRLRALDAIADDVNAGLAEEA